MYNIIFKNSILKTFLPLNSIRLKLNLRYYSLKFTLSIYICNLYAYVYIDRQTDRCKKVTHLTYNALVLSTSEVITLAFHGL